MHRAVRERDIPHFYAENSNIFLFHKLLENENEKQSAYDENFAGIDTKIEEAFADLLQADLKLSVDPCEDEATALESLSLLSSLDKKQDYKDAYLVRLLSVTTFSLYENQEQGTIASAVARISEVFRRYSERDVHIPRIIPMVNATLGRLAPGNEICMETTPTSGRDARDVFSTAVHHAFEANIRDDTASARDLILNAVPPDDKRNPSGFGISITSYHKQFKLDGPLNYIIQTLEGKSKNGKCPLFYMDPLLLSYHLQIQTGSRGIKLLLTTMEDVTRSLPDQVPYKGKLSYKFAAVYLLHGYQDSFKQENVQWKLTIPQEYNLDYFSEGMLPTNFEMR